MWIFLWVVLSAILLGSTLWSFQILRRQKQAWEIYAKSKNFTYKAGTTMGPAEMSGVIGDYKLSFFTVEKPSDNARSTRYLTAVEIELTEPVVDGGVAGTKEMLPFMQSLQGLKPFKIESPLWEEGLFAFIRYEAIGKAYFTQDRIEAAVSLLKTRNADAIIVFSGQQLVLRLETSDPMKDSAKIDKIVTRAIGLCDKLRTTPEQRKEYVALKPE